MIYDISHRTTYRYSVPVALAQHVLHLLPRGGPSQRPIRGAIAVSPTLAEQRTGQDYFGNPVSYLSIETPHDELIIHARSQVDVARPAPPDPPSTMSWDQVARHQTGDLSPNGIAAMDFRFPSPQTTWTSDLAGFARDSFAPGRPILDAALDLTRRIFEGFKYDPTATTVTTPVDEAFRLRRGVCQDFAHVEIACLRALGLSARYVSGYLLTHPPPGQEKLVGADASHAWLAVWCPGHGWVDLDPTNNLMVGDEHITLAWGRDYGDVSPINGAIFGGGDHSVDVAVDVAPQAPKKQGRA